MNKLEKLVKGFNVMQKELNEYLSEEKSKTKQETSILNLVKIVDEQYSEIQALKAEVEELKKMTEVSYLDLNGNEIEIDDIVECPVSSVNEIGFTGVVEGYHGQYVTVVVNNDNYLDILPERLEIVG